PGSRGVGESVQFSVGTEGAAEWRWDFGDGSAPVTFTSRAAGENPQHTYTAVGNYQTTVTIINCLGGSESADVSIEIIESPLGVVQFQAQGCVFGFCEFCAGETVAFSQEFTGDPGQFQYDWDGNGTFEQSASVQINNHRYTSVMVQNFFPQVRVSSGNQSVTFTHTMPLSIADCTPPPDPRITVSGPTALEVDEAGVYSATASDCSPAANGWTWTTDGGQISGSSTGSQVTVAWATPGTKTVTAQNSTCAAAVGSRNVTVTAAPEMGEILILPYFAVDTNDPAALTTFFSVRNGTDASVTVEYEYFGAGDDAPFRSETRNLVAHETQPQDMAAIPDLPVDSQGLAEGYARITVIEPILAERTLGGDFFLLDRNNAFASGSNLLTPADLCNGWNVRFLDGGGFDAGT
ncbi:MAG: PKD domain-containing protein, partial [bacterium]|nr:PKD domain-containing protein [bacterium]